MEVEQLLKLDYTIESPEERKKPYKQIEEDLKMFLREELFSYNKMTISFTKPVEKG